MAKTMQISQVLGRVVESCFPPTNGRAWTNADLVELMYVLGFSEEDIELVKNNVKSLFYDLSTMQIKFKTL